MHMVYKSTHELTHIRSFQITTFQTHLQSAGSLEYFWIYAASYKKIPYHDSSMVRYKYKVVQI